MIGVRLRPLEAGALLPLLFCVSLAAVAQEPGATFKDCATCPEMVVVPAGSFLMGTPDSAQNPARASEGPLHAVAVKAFAIGKFEVTQAEWVAVMGDDPSANKGDTLPVESVSWNAAKAFVEKLSEKTGQPYRLPTEAEWEFAVRAGSTTAFAFGDDEGQLQEHGWFDLNSGMSTHVVGEKPANKSVVTICTAMCGNGYRTASTRPMQLPHWMAARRPNVPPAIASAAAAPGTTFRKWPARPIALRTGRTTASAAWAFASFDRFSNCSSCAAGPCVALPRGNADV